MVQKSSLYTLAKLVKEVRRENIVCVVSNEHAYKDEHTIQIKDLQHEKLIIYPEICDIRKMIMTMFKGMGVTPTIAILR